MLLNNGFGIGYMRMPPIRVLWVSVVGNKFVYDHAGDQKNRAETSAFFKEVQEQAEARRNAR